MDLWEKIHQESQFVEKSMDALLRKQTGSYYTDLALTDVMMSELVANIIKKGRVCEYRFLEPCVGTGNFVFSYLKNIYPLNLEKGDILKLLDNIFVSDINNNALDIYKYLLNKISKEFWSINLSNNYFDEHISNGLLIDVTKDNLNYISLENSFKEISNNIGKFDIVVTNPPYKNLKAEKTHYIKSEQYECDKIKYLNISDIVSKKFKFTLDGVLNLYKLFVEEIIEKYSNDNAYISLLIPSSILTDKTCSKIREHILNNYSIETIKIIGENNKYIDAQQALCAIQIYKGEKSNKITITKDYIKEPDKSIIVNTNDILNSTDNAIKALTADEYRILKKLRMYPTVKDFSFIKNLRGELDLTANKKSIIQTKTNYFLLRGRNIGFYKIINDENLDYVSDDFVQKSAKKIYIQKDRIICQQIANIHKQRRVTFAFVKKNFVLGNSCNFIYVDENIYGIDIYALLGLFNCSIIDWYFKLNSSNNHINNYEIDTFPIPIYSNYIEQISSLVKKLIETNDITLIDQIEKLSIMAYNIDNNDEKIEFNLDNIYKNAYNDIINILPNIDYETIKNILDENTNIPNIECLEPFSKQVLLGIIEKYRKISKGIILNHITFKLSDLDLEMIKPVPQGGSWKDIPQDIVQKSKRLQKICETGGRTTLYGRIDYDKPSYTITTYFNRPGNGTYVHPTHERVISVREAARFQTFTDDYFFYGNKTQLLKQVGNAVPPILAYQIGKKIIEKTGCSKSIDLFCGAGGLTVGFHAAGVKSVICNDIDQAACTTIKINNPEINVICGDITQKHIKEDITKIAIDKNAEIICGGPPCQGFSMAGLRLTNDPRNQLFKEFVELVSKVKPKIVIFENVEGILSYQSGSTYKVIIQSFKEIGYKTEGKLLSTNEYAVPQKRKRLIIICTRDDMPYTPDSLFPLKITENVENQITARDTIFDLDDIECSDNSPYKHAFESNIMKFFRGKISYEEFIKVNSYSSHKKPKQKQLSLVNRHAKVSHFLINRHAKLSHPARCFFGYNYARGGTEGDVERGTDFRDHAPPPAG